MAKSPGAGITLSSTPEPLLAPLVLEESLGVCGVRDDTRAVAEAAAAWRAPGPTHRALDMGTGSGFIALYLAQRGWRVDATDISLRALELARRNAAQNGLRINLVASNLFDGIGGCYDLIAFNPPMRPDETELSRLVTSLLRRRPWLSNLLMRTVGRFFEQGRHQFLATWMADARRHLNAGGVVLMGISEEEAHELNALPGIRMVRMSPIPTMDRQEVCEFRFEDEPEASAAASRGS